MVGSLVCVKITDDLEAANLLRDVHASARKKSFQLPVDLSGAVIREEFHGGEATSDTTHAVAPEFDLAAHGEEIFEWLDIASAVLQSRRPLVFVELGSGYGRWSARFWNLAQYVEAKDSAIIMVEADPTHARWAQRNMADNGVPPDSWRLFEAAISSGPGSSLFYNRMGSEEQNPKPGEWYGQSLVSAAHPEAERPLRGFPSFLRRKKKLMDGWGAIKVKTLGMREVLRDTSHVSLMDFDIQNSEAKVVRAGIDTLSEKVERLHIGTHSQSAERDLRSVLNDNNWECVRDFPCNSSAIIEPWGHVSFQDGVQTWVNVSLVGANAVAPAAK